jgi:hypothetical protein
MSDENKTQGAQSNNITGRKIFFLYPTTSIINHVIVELAQNEYEAYVAKNHERLTPVIKKNPDCVILINIDEKFSSQEWEKWMNGIIKSTPSIKIGVFSSNNNEEFRENFIKNNSFTCCFMPLKLDMTKATDSILEMLNTLNVKGRRKYLRATTDNKTKTVINIPYSGDYIHGVIRDISVVGVSCVFDQDPDLSKNSLLKDIQIQLQSVLLKVESVVLGSRVDGGERIYVLLFTQRIDPDVRTKIRKFIQQNLQRKMDTEIN